MRIEYHRTLIADHHRNRAFRDALASLIEKGRTTVADIGAGTGLIGLMAARLGARDVYLYEVAEVAGVAAEILKRNRARNCHVMPFHSTEAADPPRVDVIVSETLGNYALEENIIDTMNDARERHLKPGGIMVPCRIRQFVALVVTPRFHEELTVWDGLGEDLVLPLDFGFAREMSLNNIYVRRISSGDLMDAGASAACWDTIDLTRKCSSRRNGEGRFRLLVPKTVYGLAVWWEAELTPEIALSTAPGAPATHWEQLYFPLMAPISAGEGDSIVVSLKSRSSEAEGTHVAWKATHQAKDGKVLGRQSMDLDKGFLP